MATKALLGRVPDPGPEQVALGLGGNLCRCATYQRIRAGIHDAAKAIG